MFTNAICSMFRPSFCKSWILFAVASKEARTRSVEALMPPAADLYNCQSAQRTTNVDGSSFDLFTVLVGLNFLIDFLISSISALVTHEPFLRVKVAR